MHARMHTHTLVHRHHTHTNNHTHTVIFNNTINVTLTYLGFLL